MVLRDYQKRTIDLIKNAMRQGYKKILVTLPTGSGKSVIMGHIARMCKDKGTRTLALMHRRQLVQQLQDRFRDCGVSSGLIMAGEASELERDCQIGTIQTYKRRLNFEEPDFFSDNIKKPWFVDAGVVFVDEAHRSLSKSFQDVFSEYADKYVIGFTATPSLSSGVAMGEFYETIIQGVSVKELVSEGSLVPGVYFGCPAPSLDGLKTVLGDYEKKGLSKRVNDKKIIGDIVQNWLKLAKNKKTIVFAVNVKHSIALVREFQAWGVRAAHLDANSSDEERAEILDKYISGEITVLSNVDLYTEGTDIPAIECVCLARPTKSIGRYIQMVGRGARPYLYKSDFFVLDHGENINLHGFYEDEIHWSLEGKKIKHRKVKRKKKEKHPLKCENCSCVFIGKVCPQCHTEIENYGKKIEAIEAELEQLDKKVVKYTFEDKKRWYAMFLSEQHRLMKSKSWLLAQYKSKFDVWPNKMSDVKPIEADREVLNWLKYQRIKWVKRIHGQNRHNKQVV